MWVTPCNGCDSALHASLGGSCTPSLISAQLHEDMGGVAASSQKQSPRRVARRGWAHRGAVAHGVVRRPHLS